MLSRIKRLAYDILGRKPWSRGYIASRNELIETTLNNNLFGAHSPPSQYGLGFDERVIEYPWALSRLSEGEGILLDAGSVLNFSFCLNHHNVRQKTVFISTLAPEKNCFWSKGVSYVFEDFRHSCFRNDYFDEIVCLSTLEHVGMDNSIYSEGEVHRDGSPISKPERGSSSNFSQAVQELHRILRPGGKLLVSVPFGKYENHGWFQVFNNEMIEQLIRDFAPHRSLISIFRHTKRGWEPSTPEEAQNSQYSKRASGQYGTSDNPVAAAEAVACIELIKPPRAS